VAKRRFLSDNEARRLVNATEAEFRPIVLATLLTGARYGELRHAQVGDYDRQSRTLWLYVTKGDDPRPACLDDEGVEMLDQASAGKGADADVTPDVHPAETRDREVLLRGCASGARGCGA
jgi:integrase